MRPMVHHWHKHSLHGQCQICLESLASQCIQSAFGIRSHWPFSTSNQTLEPGAVQAVQHWAVIQFWACGSCHCAKRKGPSVMVTNCLIGWSTQGCAEKAFLILSLNHWVGKWGFLMSLLMRVGMCHIVHAHGNCLASTWVVTQS